MGGKETVQVERGAIQQAWRLPRGGLAQLSLGYSSRRKYAQLAEAVMPLGDHLTAFRLTRLEDEVEGGWRMSAVAEYRYRMPRRDLTVGVSAGQYLDGDRGWGLKVDRYFEDTQVLVFARDTSHGRLGGVQVLMPMSRRQDPPFAGPVRLRPGDRFDFGISTTLQRPNYLRTDIGNTLFTGRSVEQTYWNEDRLYPAYLRYHVDRLKAAAAPWAGTPDR